MCVNLYITPPPDWTVDMQVYSVRVSLVHFMVWQVWQVLLFIVTTADVIFTMSMVAVGETSVITSVVTQHSNLTTTTTTASIV